MTWPGYHFVDLSADEKQVRRQTLDQYGLLAQLSALTLVVAILLYRLATRATNSRGANGDYAAVPSSPVLKVRRNSSAGHWGARSRRVRWWLGEDVVVAGKVYGQRDHYLHLTKRVGLVAISQWPLQYLLALKSLNPVAYILRSSHEQVNRWHRVLARVTSTLLCLHAALYLNFFVQRDRLDRLGDPEVLAGVMAFFGLCLLLSTALRPVRRFSYRLFFIVHLAVGIIAPILIIIHAVPSKLFLVEALGALSVDLISRKMDTVTGKATVESIPGTNLVKITASIPHAKINRFRGQPGSHIYLSLPAAARKSMSAASISHLLFELLFNPFTVAAVGDETGDLTLIARHCGGPMTRALGKLAATVRPSTTTDEDKIPLSIEGPYGAASRFPPFADFDRILLVAGGVGAVFTLPLYRSIVGENPGAKVQMVWAVRRAGDATWAVTGKEAQFVLTDDNIHLYVTGDMASGLESPGRPGSAPAAERADGSSEAGGGQVEMSAMYRDRRRDRYTSQHNRKRPDLRRIVDDLFKHGQEERVAVLVCGPREMAEDVRAYVGVWANRGRSVWYHKEGFGF
ncbi:hypothetical protein N658DRAFT_516679 [Parathielavia hyrcaniae]|uniref:FAD-binding FR-type domain-containing protein n=1 Tax=Parathielavia hyrcaniae TaxID=113614 RepID=A0AAN6PYX0_9PEZI|nr:hypothetical protein N658DRAFT_516679 [Parathielavia hyrcaniae]